MPTSMAPWPAISAGVPRMCEFAPPSSVQRSRWLEPRTCNELAEDLMSHSNDGDASSSLRATRRDVLLGGAALTVAGYLPHTAAAAKPSKPGTVLVPNHFVRIAADDSVTVIAKHLEMGQGVFTGIATIIAEELDADWSQVRVEAAPADAKRYNNTVWGPFQGTGGSSSISNSFDQLRMAGANARARLGSAA